MRHAPFADRPDRPVTHGPSPAMTDVLPRLVRQLVTLQGRLDASARGSFARWSEAGVPPSAWAVSGLRLELGLDVRGRPKLRADERTDLLVSRPGGRRSAVRLGVRFLRPDRTVEGLANGQG